MEEEWLPPGWTVQIRVRSNGKRDRCYSDPSEEHKFKSKPEVLRYLKSIERIPESEGRRSSTRNRSSLDPPAVAEQARIANCGINGQNTNKQRSKPTDTLKDEKLFESCAGGEAMKTKGINRLQVGNNNKSKNKNKSADLPRRASKRLAGVEVGPIPELSPTNKTRRIPAKKLDDTDVTTTKSSLVDTKTTTIDDNKLDCPSESSSVPKEHSIDKSDDVAIPMQDLWNDPCIEFAIKTLTGQIPIEEELVKNKAFIDVPEPSQESTFGELWADPCIQFAVKTLTGDIDIQIDDSRFKNYFQKRENGSDFSIGSKSASKIDGFCKNENSSLPKAGDRERSENRQMPTVHL